MSGLLISIVQTEEDGKGQKNEGCRDWQSPLHPKLHSGYASIGNDSLYLCIDLKLSILSKKNPIFLLPLYLDRNQECFLPK